MSRATHPGSEALSAASEEAPLLLAILGPTASGKTALAASLARKLNGAVISADSRQVFRGMDIGTGKDLHLYEGIPCHLVDIREPGEEYHVAAFLDDFHRALRQILEEGRIPILCGGTGLYIQAALQDLPYIRVPVNIPLRASLAGKSREELLETFRSLPSSYREKADTGTVKRLIRAIEIACYLEEHELRERKTPFFRSVVAGIAVPRELRRLRITERLRQRMEGGLMEEVKGLLDRGVSPQKLIFYGLEYKFITLYLTGALGYDEMLERLNTAIHRFAKRQMTFFRKMEKDGIRIHWVDGTLPLAGQVENVRRLLR